VFYLRALDLQSPYSKLVQKVSGKEVSQHENTTQPKVEGFSPSVVDGDADNITKVRKIPLTRNLKTGLLIIG
jgi:hypothetical protein